MSADTTTRRWLLRAYDGRTKDAELVHESVCVGDRALDLATRPLEEKGLRLVVKPA